MDPGLRAIQEHVPPDMPGFNILHEGQWGLLVIALLCGLSVLLTLLWLLVVWKHTRTATLRRGEGYAIAAAVRGDVGNTEQQLSRRNLS